MSMITVAVAAVVNTPFTSSDITAALWIPNASADGAISTSPATAPGRPDVASQPARNAAWRRRY